MKKLLLLFAVFSFGIVSNAIAQTEGYEIGVRLASNDGRFLSAIDGMYGLNDVNRIHGDLDFGDNYLGLSGFYEWQFNLSEDGLTWYVGPGVGMAFVSNATPIAVQGNIGIEYHFEFPLALGLEYRPSIGIIDSDGFYSNIGLMARYVF